MVPFLPSPPAFPKPSPSEGVWPWTLRNSAAILFKSLKAKVVAQLRRGLGGAEVEFWSGWESLSRVYTCILPLFSTGGPWTLPILELPGSLKKKKKYWYLVLTPRNLDLTGIRWAQGFGVFNSSPVILKSISVLELLAVPGGACAPEALASPCTSYATWSLRSPAPSQWFSDWACRRVTSRAC